MPRACRSARHGRRRATRSGRRTLTREQDRAASPTRSGSPHQKPSPTKIGDEDGRERRAEPEQRVEHEDGAVDRVGMEGRGVGVQRRHGEPEADAQERRWPASSSAYATRLVDLEELADDEQRTSRAEPAASPSEVDPLACRSGAPAARRAARRRSRSSPAAGTAPPYCVFERSYSVGSVKIVLAAGNVTSAIPCDEPGRVDDARLGPASPSPSLPERSAPPARSAARRRPEPSASSSRT